MKKLSMFIVLFICAISLGAQNVFKVVDKNPEFPGGKKALTEFIVNSIKYPKVAQECGIEGKVLVDFFINVDGSISNIKLSQGVSTSINKEALRIVSSFPKWNPGIYKGNAVCVLRTLPIIFQLN